MMPYNMTKRLIISAVLGIEDDDVSYTSRDMLKTRMIEECLKTMREMIIIETLDADYENIESLNNLDVINTMQCEKHVKSCALQNVFKIFNW